MTFADWRTLLAGVAERAIEPRWTGPLVLDEIDRTKLLIGEVKVQASHHDVENLLRRPAPAFTGRRTVLRALFAAATRGRLRAPGVLLVGPKDVFRQRSG